MMRVHELIERLEDADPDAEIRMANGSAWPLQFTILGVASSRDVVSEDGCGGCENGEHCGACICCGEEVLYVVEGSRPDGDPYVPTALWEVAYV